ncbi:methylthioribulose 1-phosphate dehydratase [Oxyplasma meridianum]|uniref:Methylthioribulose 1-phosphate dehydratase n=1 Tax=Oxyplasma meridianum TaxID=3073602 RepID=A0AAX4NIR6_9ARCH
MELEDNEKKDSLKNFRSFGQQIVDTASVFYRRGWLFGTSGNLSAVINETPLQIAITGSGLNKGKIDLSGLIVIDVNGNVISGNKKVSSEADLHIAVIREMHAGSVFHTHSVWSTMLSKRYLKDGGILIRGYEMLKGLNNVGTHEHSEWIPIIENSQDMKTLSATVTSILRQHPEVHGFMLSGHGLYTWGKTPEEAERHVEVIEFLLEVYGRGNAGTDNIP